jgi:hypothetical protein
MFHDDKFKVTHTVDKRGKPLRKSSTKDLEEFYELEEKDEETSEKQEESSDGGESEPEQLPDDDSDNEIDEYGNTIIKSGHEMPEIVKDKLKDLKVDYLRGEGVLLTDSSSDEESESEEEIFIEHVWGELDRDAEITEEPFRRLAVCNMDWDRIRAVDIMVLCNSFLPPGGSILNVKIYPSEFGKQRLAEEEVSGPQELTKQETGREKPDQEEAVDEEDEAFKEKLREYQLNRLKYYYAVIELDSVETADKVYKECDGLEYESTANRLDLRFIPDDVDFEDEPKDTCTELPDMSKYQPRIFFTTALQQAKVELTWDENDVERNELTEKLFSNKITEIPDNELRKFVNCSSEEESDGGSRKSDSEDELPENNKNKIELYKSLLEDIKKKEDEKKQRQIEMEFSWGIGMDKKSVENENADQEVELTPFEKILDKKKQKKKAKKEARKKKVAGDDDQENDYSSDDDIDMNDPYFAEEFANGEFEQPKKSKTKKNKKNLIENGDEEDEKRKAELELLLQDGDDEKAHFSLKKIQEQEEMTKSKKKRRFKKNKRDLEEQKKPEDNFQLNIKDNRFAAVYTSSDFNIDPTDPQFKKTKGMETLIHEKLKRRKIDEPFVPDTEVKKPKKDISLNLLVKNIKRKVKNQ